MISKEEYSPDTRMDAGIRNAIAVQMNAWSDTSIQCYEQEIPAFVDAALERLYGNVFSSLAYYRVFGGAENASTYVVRQGKAVSCAWLFRRHGNTVRVINEGIEVSQEDAERFAHTIFATYPQTDIIRFHAVIPRLGALRQPFQRFNCLEDMVLTLPGSADAYRASLGKSTRSYVQRYLNKLRRDFPGFAFRVASGADIEEQDLRAIIALNHRRMEAKGKESINDEATTRRIVQLARECGLVGMIVLDGRICAGAINYRAGDNYFLEAVAHDPALNDYRLGTLCCYLTICECIARGGVEYHFLWGQDEYKSRLLGVRRDLDDLVIYRSRAHMLLHGNLVLQNAASAYARRVRMWLRATRRKDSRGGRLVNRLYQLGRNLRHAGS